MRRRISGLITMLLLASRSQAATVVFPLAQLTGSANNQRVQSRSLQRDLGCRDQYHFQHADYPAAGCRRRHGHAVARKLLGNH